MSPATAQRTMRHDALFYGSEEVLAAAAVPFVREGVERGETVLVNTGVLPVTRLLKAVFVGEPLVHFSPAEVYSTPAAVLDRYQRILERAVSAGTPGVRAMGYLDLSGGDRMPWEEWVRYEAAVDRFLGDYPFRALCPYDIRAVPADALAAMRTAHPMRLEAGRRAPAQERVDPTELARRYAAGADPLQLTPPIVELDQITELRGLRMDLYPVLLPSALSDRKVDDFVKAVGEVAMNARLHGEGPVRLRVWTAPDRVVCTITDHGHGIDDPLLGYARPSRAALARGLPEQGGTGLWAARQLCDVLDYETAPGGFTVRLVAFTD